MRTRLYALSAADARLLGSMRSRCEDILAAGPWIKGAGELPHRILLRDGQNKFIVHMQVISEDIGHAFYTDGNYFVERPGDDCDELLAKAWICFEERNRRLLDAIPHWPKPEAPEHAEISDLCSTPYC